MTLKPWREQADTREEARARELLSALEQAPVPEAPPLSSVERRIVRAARVASLVRRALIGVAAVGGIAGVAWLAVPRPEVKATPPPAATPSAAPVASPVETKVAPEAPAVAPSQPAGSSGAHAEGGRGARGIPRPPPTVPAPTKAAPALAPAPAEPSPVAPAPAESTLGEEARLMAAALTALRHDKNPGGALEVLAQYRSRFPAGVLRPESVLIEAEAQRALGKLELALAALDAVPADEAGQLALEIAVVRAEVRAERGDLVEAEQGFAAALRGGASGTLGERAEFGRARCAALRLSPEAVPLLESYLERWPQGHFRAEASERLDRLKE